MYRRFAIEAHRAPTPVEKIETTLKNKPAYTRKEYAIFLTIEQILPCVSQVNFSMRGLNVTLPNKSSAVSEFSLLYSVIDPRWGVSEEATAGQSTMRICRAEIARCQAVTPRRFC